MKRISIDHLPVGTVGTALTLGNFDGVHRGHQAMFECLVKEAGVRGLVPMVLTFEPYPREFFERASAPPRLTSLTRKYLWMTQMGVDQVRVLRFNGALAPCLQPISYNAYWCRDFRHAGCWWGTIFALEPIAREISLYCGRWAGPWVLNVRHCRACRLRANGFRAAPFAPV